MATFIRTYAPQDVRVSFGGIPITGMADGEFLTVTLNADMTDEVVGAQGDVALTKIANWTGTVTITLLQNAESNLMLSNLYAAQRYSSDVVRANLTITDKSGSTLYDARDCHMKRAPDVSLSDGQNSKQWTWYSSNLVSISANSEIAQALGIAAQMNAAADLLGLGT